MKKCPQVRIKKRKKNTASGVKLRFAKSVPAGVSRGGTSVGLLTKRTIPPEGVTAPLWPSLSHPKLLSPSGGPKAASFPEVGPAQS